VSVQLKFFVRGSASIPNFAKLVKEKKKVFLANLLIRHCVPPSPPFHGTFSTSSAISWHFLLKEKDVGAAPGLFGRRMLVLRQFIWRRMSVIPDFTYRTKDVLSELVTEKFYAT
jgi:hypothetical protein